MTKFCQELTEKTTHLVAIRKGTAKANAAKKHGKIKIVNSDWLWTCAERWERVEEDLFQLTSQVKKHQLTSQFCDIKLHCLKGVQKFVM